MLSKESGPVSIMGFARYNIKAGVEAADLIAAAREWQKSFLTDQPGIVFHCFLGNLKGEFADVIMAESDEYFIKMSEKHPEAPSSQVFMDLIDVETIRLTKNLLLKKDVRPPDNFCCVEFGSFKAARNADFTKDLLLDASHQVEKDYLSHFPEIKAHFMTEISEDTYAEVSFVETSGAAREICAGYVHSPACVPLLQIVDPDTVDLDFWHVLA